MNGSSGWVQPVAVLSITAALLVAAGPRRDAQGIATTPTRASVPAPVVPPPADVAPAVAEPAVQPGRMPVFRLRPPRVDSVARRDVITRMLGAPPSEENRAQVVAFRTGRKVLEVDKRSGYIFMANLDSLWNPRLRANVPDAARARQIADRYLQENRLLPGQQGQRVRTVFSHVSETGAGEDAPGAVNRQILDRQANYRMEILVRDPSGQERAIPVYGGGGKIKVAVGGEGRVVGFSGGWREIEGVQTEAEIMPQAAAEARFRSGFGSAQVRNVRARLAYFAAPAFQEQRVLAPVWVVSAEVQVGNEMVPSREVVIPATEYAPPADPAPPAQAPRTGRETAPQVLRTHGGMLGLGATVQEQFAPAAHTAAAQTRRCGTSWIGVSQGLGGSAGNKQGFVDQCRSAGWTVSFDWGDANAWETDWMANDDAYVDNVDLVFYTGHASPSGWAVNAPNASSVASGTANVSGMDWWGNTRLRWLIVAACGPHQSTHFTTSTTNAFDRWRNVFDGLNIFLGYGAVTYDNTTEGRRFMELARSGWGVIDAWFRTAWEVQPSTNGYSAPNGPTIFVTAMYAHNGNHCQRNERLYGMGATCPPVVGAAQQRYLMWSGT